MHPRHRYNLIKMGLWLWDNRDKLGNNFAMDDYAQHMDYYAREISPRYFFTTSEDGVAAYKEPNECGTSCCVVGHSINPAIGLLAPKATKNLHDTPQYKDWQGICMGYYGVVG